MSCIYHNDHAKPVANLLYRILCCIYILVGLAITAFSIFIMIKLPKGKSQVTVVLIVGVGIIAASIIGFFGAKFGLLGHQNKYICLEIFYLIALIASVFLFIVGITLFTSPDSIEGSILSNYHKLVSDLDDDDKLKKALENIVKNSRIVGAVVLSSAIIVFLGLLLCCYLLGAELFLRCTLNIGSLVFIPLGLLFLLYSLLAYYGILEDVQEKISFSFAFVAIGSVLILLGVFGFIITSCCVSSNFMLRFYFIVMVLMGVVTLVFSIIVLALSGRVYSDSEDLLKDKCKVTAGTLQNSTCHRVLEYLLTYHCKDNLTETSEKTLEGCTPDASIPGSCKCWPLDKLQYTTWPQFEGPLVKEIAEVAESDYKLLGTLGLLTVGYFIFMVIIFALYRCVGTPVIAASRRHNENDPVPVRQSVSIE